MQIIQQLELHAYDLYNFKDRCLYSEADSVLLDLVNTKTCSDKCFLLLERRNSVYSQLLAAKTLLKLVTSSNDNLSKSHKRNIQSFVLNHVINSLNMEAYVLQSIVRVYCHITKLSWFDTVEENYIFRNVLGDLNYYIQSNNPHYMFIAVYILSSMVAEMNEVDEGITTNRHKKVSFSFRDHQLFDYFKLGCTFLQNASLLIDKINFADQTQLNLLNQSLQLVFNCLSYDFIGTLSDESGEDVSTIQVPTHWKSAFLSESLLKALFTLLDHTPTVLSILVLKCLVQMASLRRSLFNANERMNYLQELCQGVKRCISLCQERESQDIYHEVCRFLARLKMNFQLTEFLKMNDYSEFLKSIANFTVSCFQMDFPTNSSYYLLCFWQKMVAPIPYIKTAETHMLEVFTPDIFKIFVLSRIELIKRNAGLNYDDPLEDQAFLSQHLELVAAIGRYEYKEACTLLVHAFDEASQQFGQTFNESADQNILNIAIQEGCLSWLILVIGAVIGGRVSFASTEEHDLLDGELVCRVLKLMNETDYRLSQNRFEKLERAYISFLDHFRKIYIGDQIQKTFKVYKCLNDVFGISDETTMLKIIIHKIMTNLKCWGTSERVVEFTLNLFNDLSVGFSSVRKIVKLEEIQFILYNHSADHFEFLRSTSNVMKCRTLFYTSLSRILVLDLTEDEDEMFWRFISPIQASFNFLKSLLVQNSTSTNEIKNCIIGLCLDIKGIALAFNTKHSYMMLFNWFFPDNSLLLMRMLEAYYYDPQITTSLLKLYHEFSYNRSQRLVFDISSPNGIILFREVSRVLTTYGDYLLNNVNIPGDKLYIMKLKGITICFRMLKSALSGNYLNFGVFKLYEDPALNNALQVFVKFLLSIDLKTLKEYPKLMQSYFSLLETVSQDHLSFIGSLDASVLTYIFSTLSSVLLTTEPPVLTSCCAILDNIITHLYKVMSKKSNELAHGLLNIDPSVFKQILSDIFNVTINYEIRNQWSLSRPMFGLILLHEEHFNNLKNEFIQNVPLPKQAAVAECFVKLMDGVEKSLSIKNRDKFTHNVTVFKHDFSDAMKVNEFYPTNSMF
uniref:Exportin-7/Ran-binding protein 17 TPR repeats domain-containing protein n=1 Tax=Helobdella robusta TaxID=6412 RepID=T1G0A4_HELRO